MEWLENLTKAQYEAVTHIDGPLLILAGAGSGKTRVITRRVAHLLGQAGVLGSRILAVTFTNKASQEMRERIDALAPDSGVWIGTFHGFCVRLLRKYGFSIGLAPGFTIYDRADRLAIIKRAMQQTGLDEAGLSPERVESAIGRAKNDLIAPDAYARHFDHEDHDASAVGRIFLNYQELMDLHNAVDFDDLLARTVALLRSQPEIRARLDRQYQYILVDEYQDTNLAQYAIVRALSTDTANLCVTGDPDQSIYAWRGANLSNILEFENDYPNCRTIPLEHNFRSSGNILQVADCLIRHNRRRKDKTLRATLPDGDPVRVTLYADESQEARGVAGQIGHLTREGAYQPCEIAVFYRITALTRRLEIALQAEGIPYEIVGGVSFYERQEIKDVLAFVSLALNPSDDLALRRVLNVPPRGLGPVALKRIEAHAEASSRSLWETVRVPEQIPGLKPAAVRGLHQFRQLVDELAARREEPVAPSLMALLQASEYPEMLRKAGPDGDDRLANLDELVNAAHAYDRSESRDGGLLGFLEQSRLVSAVDRWDECEGSVALMTLHSAKGLEFPVVFLIGLEQGILPHVRSADRPAALEEERRLLFVGITRARRELYLSAARQREVRGQRQVALPSPFLQELPEDAVHFSDRSGLEIRSRRPAWQGGPGSDSNDPAQPSRTNDRTVGFQLHSAADLARAQNGDLRSSPETSDPDQFRRGSAVLHPQYGLGTIQEIQGVGPKRKVRVAFAVHGLKTFLLEKATLRVVPRPRHDNPSKHEGTE